MPSVVGDEHRSLCRFQLSIRTDDETGKEYLEYTENVSKNNQRGLAHHNVERKVVRAYANKEKPERCILTLYKKYLQLCPEVGEEGAFYLHPLKRCREDQWYSAQPVGRNPLGNVVKSVCDAAGIQGKYNIVHLIAITLLIVF